MELSIEQKNVLQHFNNAIKNKKKPFQALILGSAGTGKTYLINKFKEILNKNNKRILITSLQAIVNQKIDGVTIHKLFGFDKNRLFANIFIDKSKYYFEKEKQTYVLTRINDNYNKFFTEFDNKRNFSKIAMNNWIILDEISMVGLEILEDMNILLQQIFNNDKTFGNVNFILLGDLYQLDPISETPLYKCQLNHFIYQIKLFELTENKRQNNKEFFELCEGIKKGILTETQENLLKTRLLSNFPDIEQKIIHIFPKKNMCEQFNIKQLKKLDAKKVYFIKSNDYSVNVIFNNRDFENLTPFLILAKGAKIITTINKPNNEYVNGDKGYIKQIIASNYISKKDFFKNLSNEHSYNLKKEIKLLKDKEIYFINSFDCTLITKVNNKIFQISSITRELLSRQNKLLFRRTMLPVKLAWSLTTHKIQGETLETAVINLGQDNFDPVQNYIAISRLTSLDNLFISKLDLPIPKQPNLNKIQEFIQTLKK